MTTESEPEREAPLGRAGRGRRQRPEGEVPRLASAGFLALLRDGRVPHAGRAELLRGVIVPKPAPSADGVALLVGLQERLEEASRAWAARLAAAAQGAQGAAASSGGFVPPAGVEALPLVPLGPDLALRPDLAVLARPAKWSGGPGPVERLRASGGAPPEAVVVALELRPAAERGSTAGRGRRAAGGARPVAGEGGPVAGARRPLDRAAAAVALAQDERLAAYALAGVREVWVLDLVRGWTEAYRAPWGGSYRSRTLWYPGEEVPIAALGGAVVESLELA